MVCFMGRFPGLLLLLLGALGLERLPKPSPFSCSLLRRHDTRHPTSGDSKQDDEWQAAVGSGNNTGRGGSSHTPRTDSQTAEKR